MFSSELHFLFDHGLPMLLQFGTAILVGGLLGYERQRLGKPVGMLTAILVALGAAVITRAGVLMAEAADLAVDPTRISSTIVSGIGFIGAGAIIRSKFKVSGLASAATIWILGALGILVGAGYAVMAVGLTIVIFLLLRMVPKMEHLLFRQRACIHLKLVVERGRTEDLLEFLEENQVSTRERSESIEEGRTVLSVHECGLEHRGEFMRALRRFEGVLEISPG